MATTAVHGGEATWQTHQRAVEAVELNRQLEKAELRKLELQRSDLLLLNNREQATFDARMTVVNARLQYHQAQYVRRAVLAIDADSFANPDCVPMRFRIEMRPTLSSVLWLLASVDLLTRGCTILPCSHTHDAVCEELEDRSSTSLMAY